jgi:hypothetical protein
MTAGERKLFTSVDPGFPIPRFGSNLSRIHASKHGTFHFALFLEHSLTGPIPVWFLGYIVFRSAVLTTSYYGNKMKFDSEVYGPSTLATRAPESTGYAQFSIIHASENLT